MKLIRYTDLNDLESLFSDSLRAFGPFMRNATTTARRAAVPRSVPGGVEWFEDENCYYARVELPGVKRDHLRLDVEDGLIRMVHNGGGEDEQKAAQPGRFEQVLRCPDGIRVSAIEARLADGILHLTFPKEEVRKPVSISIN